MIKRFFRQFKQSSFFHIYLTILFPILVIIICFVIVSFMSVKNYKATIIKAYSYSLASLFRENSLNIEKITQSIPQLSKDADVANLILGNSISASETSAAIENLRIIKKNNSYIDSIAIFNRSTDLIFSTNGNSEAHSFFDSEFSYTDYDYSYWKSFHSPVLEYQILPPTTVSEYTNRRNIIPIVFSRIGNIQTSNLFIINLDIDSILSNIQKEALTPNSTFLFVNKKHNRYFSVSDKEINIISSDFFQRIIYDTYSIFDAKTAGNQKQLIIAYSPSNSLSEYCFAVAIPYKDIYAQAKSFQLLSYILAIFVVIFTLTAAYFSTKHVYAPFEKIATMFGMKKNKENSDTIQYIYSSVLDTINSNRKLKEEYSTNLPFSAEKFIVNTLNSEAQFFEDDSVSHKLSDIFEYSFFSTVIFKILPSEKFGETFSIVEFGEIQNSLYNIIRILFNERFRTYVIPSETDTLYLLLNLPSADFTDEINNTINELDNLLKNDLPLVHIYIGLGGICHGPAGLRETHAAAVAAIPSDFDTDNIKVNITAGKNLENFLLRSSDENNLSNMLITGQIEQANTLIQNILDTKKAGNLSDYAFSQLAVQVLTILFRVMRTKNLNYDPEYAGDTVLIQNIIALPYDKLMNTIFEFTNQIFTHMDTISLHTDIKEIINYMHENYTKDINRDTTAQVYHISPKHLSSLLKQEVGMNFTDYLAYIRIEKAKTLLKTTKLSITEIYESTGFNNRTTFIRTFKKETGLTPSEFRKII